jgi:hypothetical protein
MNTERLPLTRERGTSPVYECLECGHAWRLDESDDDATAAGTEAGAE